MGHLRRAYPSAGKNSVRERVEPARRAVRHAYFAQTVQDMEIIAHILFRARYVLCALTLALTAFFGLSISMEMENSISSWFSPDDPVSVNYQAFRDTFEGSRYLIAAVEAGDLFTREGLDYLRRKTAELKGLERVKQAYSLAMASKIIGTAEGMEIEPLLKNLEHTDTDTIRRYALEDELFAGYLVSRSGTLGAIVLVFDDMDARVMAQTVAQIEACMEQDRPAGVGTFLSGDIMVNHEFNRVTEQNETILPILGLVVIVVIVYVLFRSPAKIGIAVAVILMSLCWTLGFHSLLGLSFNALSGMIIPLIIILSVSNTVHIMEYFEEVRENANAEHSFVNTVSYITTPCFHTSVTTSLGLLSLATSPISAVRHFGMVSAAGVMFGFIISLCIVPLMLTLTPAHRKIPHKYWGHLLAAVFRINERHSRLILFMTAAALAIAVLGMSRVRIETNELEWFPQDSAMYRNAKTLDRELTGIGTLEILIEGESDLMMQPGILSRMDALALDIEAMPEVKKVISLAGYVKALNRALNEGSPDEYRIPDSRELIAQEILLMSFSETGTEELERVASHDFSKGRIAVKLSYGSSEQGRIISEKILALAKNAYDGVEGLRISVTGSSYLLSMLDKYIVESQIKSFSLAFALVFGMLFLILFSIRFGLLSLLPNLLPIMFVIGIMGWAGISLNVGTVMISSVALGIAVDDSIHLISRFRKELAGGRNTLHAALRKATILVGRALIFTTVIIVASFSVVIVSGFQPSRDFGLLLSLTLFIALICDLFVLSSLVLVFRRFFEKDAGRPGDPLWETRAEPVPVSSGREHG